VKFLLQGVLLLLKIVIDLNRARAGNCRALRTCRKFKRCRFWLLLETEQRAGNIGWLNQIRKTGKEYMIA
jgi:hypothetical protein